VFSQLALEVLGRVKCPVLGMFAPDDSLFPKFGRVKEIVSFFWHYGILVFLEREAANKTLSCPIPHLWLSRVLTSSQSKMLKESAKQWLNSMRSCKRVINNKRETRLEIFLIRVLGVKRSTRVHANSELLV
jgi:hypothetical protein